MKRSLTEDLSYQCTKLVFKSRVEDLVAAALNEGITDGVMLVEAFNDEDASQLEAAAKKMAEMIGNLEKKFGDAGEGWKPVVDALKSAAGDLDTKSIAQMAISGEKKKLAKASAEYTKKIQSIASEVAAILDATEQMKKNLKNFESDVGDKGESTIAALSDEVEKFPDVGKLDKGIDSVYKVPKWFQSAWAEGSKAAESETKGGFFKKAMSFIGGLFKGAKSGRIVDAGVLADAIKNTPFQALMDLDLQGEVAELKTSSEAAATETAELSAAGAAATEGGGEGGEGAVSPEEAEAVEKELGAPPAPADEAEEEQAAAQEELESAAQEVAGEAVPPAVAAATAIDTWNDSLSDTSQKALQSADRLGSLKSDINSSLEGAAEALAKEVQGAIAKWRSDNEETLMKSKRFAKKNFDSLENLIPQLVGAMLKKTSESKVKLTRGMVYKTVHRYLDRHYKADGVLFESKRWETLAGMRRK